MNPFRITFKNMANGQPLYTVEELRAGPSVCDWRTVHFGSDFRAAIYTQRNLAQNHLNKLLGYNR